MPIIEAAEDSGELAQGDILELPNGGLALAADLVPMQADDARYGLVLSRDCAGVHGTSVVLAEIVTTRLDVPNIKEETSEARFERLLAVLENVRDGGTSPDRFYLGTLAGDNHRSCARLDRLISVRPPLEPKERSEWVRKHRKFRLASDFRKSLPTRIYWALCRVGFDDRAWFSAEDRKLLMTAGESFLHEIQSALSDAQTELELAQLGTPRGQELQKRKESVAQLATKLARTRDRIEGIKEVGGR